LLDDLGHEEFFEGDDLLGVEGGLSCTTSSNRRGCFTYLALLVCYGYYLHPFLLV